MKTIRKNIHQGFLLDHKQIYISNKMVTSNKDTIVTLLVGMIIFASIIHVCGAQTEYSLVNELKQDYNELIDVMYSSDDNPNFEDKISQYGANSEVEWNAQEEYDEFEATRSPFSSLNDDHNEKNLYTIDENNTIETNKYFGKQNKDLQKRIFTMREDEALKHDNKSNHNSHNQSYVESNETSRPKYNFSTLQKNITNPTNESSSDEKKKMCLLGVESDDDDYEGILKSQDEGNLESLYTIVVEGNIASGKTTFVNLFKRYQQVMVLPEPVEEWQNVNGTDLLDLMFHNGTRYFGTFQLESSFTRLKQALRVPPLPSQNHGIKKTIRLMERSLFSERYVFLEGAHQSDQLSSPEYALMKQWFDFSVDKFRKQIIPDLIVYLRCPIEILKERVMMRGRPEEKRLDWDFVVDKQKRYEDYLFYKNSSFPVPSEVIVLDGGLSLDNFARSVHDKLPNLFPSWKLLRGLQRRKSRRGKKL